MSERIILRVNRFTKIDEFKRIKDYWEKEIPNAIVIPYTFNVENLRELKGKDISDTVEGHCEFKCSVCGAEISVIEGGNMDGVPFKYCPNCGVEMG